MGKKKEYLRIIAWLAKHGGYVNEETGDLEWEVWYQDKRVLNSLPMHEEGLLATVGAAMHTTNNFEELVEGALEGVVCPTPGCPNSNSEAS